MSTKSPGKSLQRLAEDELGVRPSLQGCHNIMRDAGTRPAQLSREEWLSTIFITNRDRLLASAERRADKQASR